MLFSSPRFAVFLALLLLVLAGRFNVRQKKGIITVASCLFYSAWDYRYLLLLLAISGIDYFAANAIERNGHRERARKAWVTLSIVSNLGILGYFKYYNFFVHNLNGVLAQAGYHLPYREILLPAGISFYTFKSMSYTIDVYRREIDTCKSYLDYAMFITFFPELIAGPIVRASVLLPQLDRPAGATRARLAAGTAIFLQGLTKKRLIADPMATIADPIFAAPHSYNGATLWCGALAYAIQIYCDFSGYSDMAIGCGKMIGYDLPENFDMPYLSVSVTEFWRRWHITLSSWLRDYLYISLGGNRHGRVRTYTNLFLTMLLGGLWHGASWNFVAWGAIHGAALAAHKAYRARFATVQLPAPIAGALTFLFVLLCWVPFRSPSFGATRAMLYGMFSLQGGAVWLPERLGWGIAMMAVGHALGVLLRPLPSDAGVSRTSRVLDTAFGIRVREDAVSGWYAAVERVSWRSAALIAWWCLTLFYFAAVADTAFIYFQF